MKGSERTRRATEVLVGVLRAAGHLVETEWPFHPSRRWRFDVALPLRKVAVEVEGLNGRHQRTAGFLRDMEKYDEAVILGWRVLRVTARQLESGDALVLLHRLGLRVRRKEGGSCRC